MSCRAISEAVAAVSSPAENESTFCLFMAWACIGLIIMADEGLWWWRWSYSQSSVLTKFTYVAYFTCNHHLKLTQLSVKKWKHSRESYKSNCCFELLLFMGNLNMVTFCFTHSYDEQFQSYLFHKRSRKAFQMATRINLFAPGSMKFSSFFLCCNSQFFRLYITAVSLMMLSHTGCLMPWLMARTEQTFHVLSVRILLYTRVAKTRLQYL